MNSRSGGIRRLFAAVPRGSNGYIPRSTTRRLYSEIRSGYNTSQHASSRLNTLLTIGLTAGITGVGCYAYNKYTSNRTVAKQDEEWLTTATAKIETASRQPTKSFASPDQVQEAISILRSSLGESKVSQQEVELLSHASAAGTHHGPLKPDVVVYVESTNDVVTVLQVANRFKVPVIPYSGVCRRTCSTSVITLDSLAARFSGGTSLEGHITAPYGGICVDLSRMDKIIALNGALASNLLHPHRTRTLLIDG